MSIGADKFPEKVKEAREGKINNKLTINGQIFMVKQT
jgi:hypothetical protein